MKEETRKAKDEVEQLLLENDRRIKELEGRHNQLTGEGMWGHTEKVVIDGYPIKTQWLTKEVADNPLYKVARKLKSIRKIAEYYSEKEGIDIDETDLVDELTNRRLERDPSFAFQVCFQIEDKKTGEVIPFRLNYAQRILLMELEKLRLAGKPIFLVLLKARQWGGSTLVQLYMAWLQLFVRDGWNSIILAQTKDTARRIKGMYTLTLDNFPYFVFKRDELKFSPFERSNADSVITDRKGVQLRRCKITVASYENYESARGANIAMAHFSEVAYWRTTPLKSAESLITNIDGGMNKEPLNVQVLESTARGNTGFFYDEYQLAKKGKSNRKALFIPFFFLERDMIHFRNRIEKKRFARQLLDGRKETVAPDETHESGAYLYGLWLKGATLEHINWYIHDRAGKHSHEAEASEAPSDDYECFTFSGNKVFSIEYIINQEKEYKTVPVWTGNIRDVKTEGGNHTVKLTELKSNAGGQLKIWKHPDRLDTENQYLVVVDVGGRSNGADYSVITVINRWGLRIKLKPREDVEEEETRIMHMPQEVVARWRGHLRYDLMAKKAVAIARYYKNALLVFESNTFDKKKAEAQDFVESGDHISGILETIRPEYDNLYKRKSTDAEDIKAGKLYKLGFQTNRKTKEDMVDLFTVEFEGGGFIDHDEIFYNEAAIYEQRPDGSYGNIVGKDNHDDVLMTDMIGMLVSSKMALPSLRTERTSAPVVL